MYDEVIDTLAFDSVDLALRIMIPECANSREHCKNNVTDKILKITQKIWQLTCDDVRDKLFRSGLFEAGRFLEAHRDGESGF